MKACYSPMLLVLFTKVTVRTFRKPQKKAIVRWDVPVRQLASSNGANERMNDGSGTQLQRTAQVLNESKLSFSCHPVRFPDRRSSDRGTSESTYVDTHLGS